MRDKPYCKAPWIGLAYEGTTGCKPCCEFQGADSKTLSRAEQLDPSNERHTMPWGFQGTHTEYVKSDYLKDFKKMMYEDEMNEGCRQCIDHEMVNARGWGKSRRQKFAKYKINEHGDNKIVRFDYRAGNKCNLSCRMCHPESSSMREEEEIKLGNITAIYRVLPNTNDVYDIDLSGCETLSILGGEPSIDLGVRKWIDHIQDLDVIARITTNATNTSKKWFDTLRKLKKLEILLSIDGTGAAQDFQRKGSVWADVKPNILKYKDEFEDVTIQITASAINFTIIDTWWEEMMELDVPVFCSAVTFPLAYNLSAIPDEIKATQVTWLKKWIDEKSTVTELREINEEIEWMTNKINRQVVEAKEAISILENYPYNPENNKKFKEVTKIMDGCRNENISQLHQRFKEIMND